MSFQQTFGALRRPARAALAALALGVLGACDLDEVLTVPDPDVATPGSVQNVSALPAVRAGALGDLALALTGSAESEDGLVQYTGMLGDEMVWAETFPTRGVIDQRNMVPINSTLEEMFYRIQRARASAERAADGYTRLLPNAPERSEMYSLAGFAHVFIGEAYCSGVPLSRLVDGVQEFGEPRTTQESFQRAVQLFDSALAVAPAGSDVRYLAQVGKGRALLNLDDAAGAAAAVAGVPTSFVYELEFSENTARQNNGVYVVTHLNTRFSVSPDSAGGPEGIVGLPYVADNDPRVPATLPDLESFDGVTPLWLQEKYDDRESPFQLATGIEARLIEAEAQLAGGNALGALTTLNNLRAATGTGSGGVAGLAPLTLQVTPQAQVRQLFKERAYWMWLTAHRLGDMRRLITQYADLGFTEDTVFPTGPYFKEGDYGNDTDFPIPFSERNNPRYLEANLDARGCLVGS